MMKIKKDYNFRTRVLVTATIFFSMLLIYPITSCTGGNKNSFLQGDYLRQPLIFNDSEYSKEYQLTQEYLQYLGFFIRALQDANTNLLDPMKDEVFLVSGLDSLVVPIIDVIRTAMEQDNINIATRAIRALGIVGSDKAISFLQDLPETDAKIKACKEWALGNIITNAKILKNIWRKTEAEPKEITHKSLEIRDINLANFVKLWLSYPIPTHRDIGKILSIAEYITRGANKLPVILDIGAGKGYLSYLLAESGRAKVIAVDRPDIAECCRFRHPNMSFQSIEKIEEITKSFTGKVDVVICSWMPENVDFTPEIRELNADVVIYIRDYPWKRTGITPERIEKIVQETDPGDVGIEPSFTPGDGYYQRYSWKGYSIWGLVAEGYRGYSAEYLIQAKKGITLNPEALFSSSTEDKYPYEEGLMRLVNGVEGHDIDSSSDSIRTAI